MNATPYTPLPLDTRAVTLPPELEALTEKLAENTHDLWSQERIAQGWKYGLQRDDNLKEHPGLVPYKLLSESEKQFDRNTAMGTLKAILALGHRVEPAPCFLDADQARALATWREMLEREADSARANGPRAWTFDMDDEPESQWLAKTGLTRAHEALEAIRAEVYPAWQAADQAAMRLQKRHRFIATLAIWPGITAVLAAIAQLTVRWISSEGSGFARCLSYIETISVIIAAGAVLVGFLGNLHHGWLAQRQRAERLRILKFRALSWSDLWCNPQAWRDKLAAEVQALANISSKAAHHWAKEDAVKGDAVTPPSSTVPMAELQSLAQLYRVKRLEFQRHYFEYQSAKAHRSSWLVDKKAGLIVFGLSVLIVLAHSFHLLPHDKITPPHGQAGAIEIIAIALAAMLPVAGFGFRAWVAAFEAPRSRNLYRAKALALRDYIRRSAASESSVELTLEHIAQGEHFFANEHREWCRLQMEAEWFV